MKCDKQFYLIYFIVHLTIILGVLLCALQLPSADIGPRAAGLTETNPGDLTEGQLYNGAGLHGGSAERSVSGGL